MIHPANVIPWHLYRDSPSVDFFSEIQTVSEANATGEHWTRKHARHALQKRLVRLEWLKRSITIEIPCHVSLCRHSPRSLDTDNLASAFKTIRDTIADMIIPGFGMGRADNDPCITWSYHQIKDKQKGISIKIYEAKPDV